MYQYLFFIGDFPVRTYGLVLSLSIVLGTGVAYFLARQDGRWHSHIVDMGIYCGLMGILGARLWDVFFFDWDYYHNHLSEILNVWQGGMAIQGGLVFGVVTGIIYAVKHKIDVLVLADIVCPGVILGQGLGRCANLLNGDAFGAPTGSSFGIVYPDTTLAYQTYGSVPLWPAEVWEGQLDFVIFAVLLIYRVSVAHKSGQVFMLYIMLYSIARFFLEYLRGDYNELIFGLFKSAQMTSILSFGFALFFYLYFQYMGSYDSLERKMFGDNEENSN